jgi:hypothetical protein
MNKPFSDYHRRALGSLAADLLKARDEREQRTTLHRMLTAQDLCPLCPPLIDREGGAHIDTHAQVQNSEQPAPHIHIDRGWWQVHAIPLRRRLAARWKRFVEALVDPVIRR